MGDSRGFTLLEVLVSLTVLSLALGAILKATSTSAVNLEHLRSKTAGHWVAMNVVAEYQLAMEWPAMGTQKGEASMAGEKWDWTAQVSGTPDKDMRRLDVTVVASEDGDIQTSLTAFLPRTFK